MSKFNKRVVRLQDTPMHASVKRGEVVFDRPRGGAFTPDAAEETGRRLIAAAEEARRR